MQVHELDLVWRLGLALGLSSVIGVEREVRQKSAGLRTNALVGTGAALFVLVSQYGFAGVLGPHVTLDPSRVAAQIVSGIGFIGGGLIFVRRTDVRGLTTAASVWVSAAVGMASGGDLPVLASVTTGAYLLVTYGFRWLERRLPQSQRTLRALWLTYLDGRGVLRRLLSTCSEHGFDISDVSVVDTGQRERDGEATVTVRLLVHGRGPAAELTEELRRVEGVLDASASAHERGSEDA